MTEARPILTNGLLGGRAHGFLTGPGHDGEPDPALLVRGGKLVRVRQTHSATALAVTAPFNPDDLPEADGMATATRRLVLAIVTADCAPVLLRCPVSKVVGAAHAGWRGALGGVLDATVERMVELGAERGRIRAVIGPCIAQPSYEVDAAFRDRFLAHDPANAAWFWPDTGQHSLFDEDRHFQFDLPGYVRQRLFTAGIHAVADLGIDTYADEKRFHSYRRATHRNEPGYGRQFSLIAVA